VIHEFRAKNIGAWLIGVGTVGTMLLVSYVFVWGQTLGSKTLLALAVAVALAPIVIYAGTRRPLVFPFGLFAMLAPMDELLGLSKFGTLLRLIGAASFAAMVFWMLKNKRWHCPPPALYVWLGVVVWMSLTLLWALDATAALGRLETVLQLVSLYLVISLMPVTLADLRAIMFGAALGGVLAAAYGVYYFHQNLASITQRLLLSNGQDVIDPNHFAAAMILPIAIVTVGFLLNPSPMIKLALVGAEVILLMGVYATGSRGGLLGVAVVFVYLAWRSRHRLHIIALMILGVLTSFFMPTSIWARFSNALTTHGSGREDIWRVGLAAFERYWLAGAGLENFPVAFNRVYMRVFTPHGIGWARAAHNLIMQTGVELGLVGLLLLLGVWWTQFRMLNQIPEHSTTYPYRLICQGTFLGLFVAAMFLDIMYRKYTWLVFITASLTYTAWQVERASIEPLSNRHYRHRPHGITSVLQTSP
jgi:hypothetical protein